MKILHCARWGASEGEALGTIMSTASKLYRESIKHRVGKGPVYKLLYSSRQSSDASLRHQAWLEFFTTREAPDEFYSACVTRKEALW